MNIKDVIKLEKKKSNLEEFLNFAFDQPIPYQFRTLSYLPVDFSKITTEVDLYQIENEELFFSLEFKKKPILIYKINLSKNIISEVHCLNNTEYAQLLKFFVENLQLSKIPTL